MSAGNPLQRHHRDRTGLFGDQRLLGGYDVHDDAALQHLRQTTLYPIGASLHSYSLLAGNSTRGGRMPSLGTGPNSVSWRALSTEFGQLANEYRDSCPDLARAATD